MAGQLEFKAGYQKVSTPHIAKTSLYYKTGHLPYYQDNMFPVMKLNRSSDKESAGQISEEPGVPDGNANNEEYVLRPMNCPHHHAVFSSRPKSFRDLPVRYAEYGQVYRYEESGAVSGLVRVRALCINDAHIYCAPNQIQDEIIAITKMYQEVYSILNLEGYSIRLSRWDPDDPKKEAKYVDDPENWELSEGMLRDALVSLDIPFEEVKGEAAFYGPKIDIQFPTVTGREETVSTIQLDFAIPKRLGLQFMGSDGNFHTPVCIHRAPLSTHERMVAILLEQTGGAFPTWLAPVQAYIVPISQDQNELAENIHNTLKDLYIRSEIAIFGETLNKRIRNGITRKIPNILVIGKKEVENGTVTLRRYGSTQTSTMPLDSFLAKIKEAGLCRSDEILL